MTSAMRETMAGQAEALARLLEDDAAVGPVAERLRGRRVLTLGTGTSWHAANQAAALLRRAGLDADAAQSADVVLGDDEFGPPARAEVVLAFTHTGPRKRFTAQAIAHARGRGLDVIQISGQGIEDADLITVAQERSAAYTASHLGALLRAAQLAVALGAELPVAGVPCRRGRAARGARPGAATVASHRVHGRRHQRLDGGRGRAEDPRDVLRRQ